MKVAVTGGTGLVGSHLLIQLIKKGYSVVAIKRANSDLNAVANVFEHYDLSSSFEQIKWVEGDILDPIFLGEFFDGIDVVYHAAALVSFHSSDYDALITANVEGTANVVNACLDVGVKALGYVSSTAAIGKSNNSIEVTEDLPWDEKGNPSGYSISKHYAEREVWRGAEEGLDVTIVNPCIVLGPGKWGSSSTTLLDSVNNELAFYSKGANAFVDARDVANILIELLEKQIFNERFLVIGENLSFKDIFTRLAEKLERKAPHIETREWMTSLAWRVAWLWGKFSGRKPAITKETAASAQQVTIYSREKLNQTLPHYKWHSVDEAILNTTQAFLKYRLK